MKGVSLAAARAAKRNVAKAFRDVGEVVGVGLVSVDDGYGIKVNLARPLSDHASAPVQIDGVPIRIEVVGTIRKR
jgi:predicted secreted protein